MTLPYMHTDGRVLRLGKRTPVRDSRVPDMAKYASVLPPPPTSCDWTKGVTSFGQMLNNRLGDCTCAAIGHAVQIATLNTHDFEITPGNSVIELLYEDSCGYVPGNPNSDQGGVCAYVLNYALAHGLGTRKRNRSLRALGKIAAYAYIDLLNTTLIKQALATFGILYVGVALPWTAQAQVGSLWTVVGNPNVDPQSQPNSWGGHCLTIVKYDAIGPWAITWGALQHMTWQWFATYCDEAYALLFSRWVQILSPQLAALVTQLESDLAWVAE
jgi:hypothetical protein